MSRATRILLTTLFIFMWGQQSYATETAPASSAESSMTPGMCINGDQEKNQELIQTFNESFDPLKIAYLKAQGRNLPFAAVCARAGTFLKNTSALKNMGPDVISFFNSKKHKVRQDREPKSVVMENPPAYIKKSCIDASLKRFAGSGTNTYICKNGQVKKSPGPTQNKAQCVNKELADYMQFAVNSAIRCLSSVNYNATAGMADSSGTSLPVDARTIFRKFNNESGFNMSVASAGGTGIGQITSIAAKELVDPNKGNGTYIFQQISESDEKSCQGFKDIAKKDLENKKAPSVGGSCSWVSPGDGLARNLLYGIGYYLVLRDHYIPAALRARDPALASNPDLINALTTVGYGREGIKKVKSLLQKYRVGKKTDVNKFIANVKKDSVYTREIGAKMKEMYCIDKGYGAPSSDCNKLKLTPEELEGDQCVGTK